MTIEIPVAYTDIKSAYEHLYHSIQNAFATQAVLNTLESEKADIWAQLTSNPDFKPGNSNLQRDAKLRAANSHFMDKYEETTLKTEETKLIADLARLRVSELQDLLRLGRILAALEDD